MFQEKKGDIWSVWPNEVVVVTTNGVLNKANQLVMGKGIAAEALLRVPSLAYEAGEAILVNGLRYYMLTWVSTHSIILLQTKLHWRDPSPLDLVEESLELFGQYAETHENKMFHAPRFGCGNGRLDWEKQVRPLCEQYIPDNVTIWSK